MTTSPAQRKLCSHVIEDGCNYGSKCNRWHPIDVDEARAAHAVSNTLNLCAFYPNCTRTDCTFLHIDVHAKPGAPPVVHAPGRAPPSDDTPSRPSAAVESRRGRGGGRGRGRGGHNRDQQSDGGHVSPEKPPTNVVTTPAVIDPRVPAIIDEMRQLSNKINAISLYAGASNLVPAASEAASKMLHEVRTQLKQFNTVVDTWLAMLATSAADGSNIAVGAPERRVVQVQDDDDGDAE